jgi:SHS2 domain-containing protein
LRSERRYERISDLVAQIERDTEAAREILRGHQEGLPQWRPVVSLEAHTYGPRVGHDVGHTQYRARPIQLPLHNAALEPCAFCYEEIGHTADRALRVTAGSLTGLFVGAARGMYGLMADIEGLIATTWRQVQLEDWDRESLLVGWLNELLFLSESEGLLFREFRIEALTDTSLVGWAGGMRGQPTRALIKAATFHDLVLDQDEEEWSTVVTFDV